MYKVVKHTYFEEILGCLLYCVVANPHDKGVRVDGRRARVKMDENVSKEQRQKITKERSCAKVGDGQAGKKMHINGREAPVLDEEMKRCCIKG